MIVVSMREWKEACRVIDQGRPHAAPCDCHTCNSWDALSRIVNSSRKQQGMQDITPFTAAEDALDE